MSNKYFSIIVQGSGFQSSEAEEGELNKTTGLPDGKTSKIKLQVGAVSIPNFSRVWAKRLKDKKDQPTGELEFLPWGEKGGEMVAIRYLPGCPSLDKHYQTNVLKVVLTDEENNESAYIDLTVGVNDYDLEIADPMFITMLEHHTYCKDNKSRKKDSRAIQYEIYNPQTMNKNKIDKLRLAKKAQDYILATEDDTERLIVFAELFDLDALAQNAVIFNELLEILEDDSERVLKVIDLAKEKFKYQLTSLEEQKVIEFTLDGDLVETVDNERDFIMKGGEAKEKLSISHLVDNILEPENFKVYKRVREITDQLLQLLQ